MMWASNPKKVGQHQKALLLGLSESYREDGITLGATLVFTFGSTSCGFHKDKFADVWFRNPKYVHLLQKFTCSIFCADQLWHGPSL